MRKVIFYVFPLAIFFAFLISCQIGLGKEVDLEAPIITLTKMQSGSTEVDSSHFGGGVYCKKTVSFFGTATDNVKVESVNAEIKWNNEVDFQPLSSTTLSGDSFQFDFTFETTGIAYIKFVATDEAGNYNVKSSRVVTLLVDDEAPVGKSWYINRKLNGIQYALKPLEELKELDLDLPENKDAAQNVAFSIHSAFNDEMGIKPGSVSIKIKDESGNLVCEVPNSTSNDYSPVFEITHDILVGGGSQYATGKHYLQVWYDAEDVVTLPESNKAQDIEVDGGWFIWWPESDLPKVSQRPSLDDVTNSIMLNVNEAVTITITDDDALSEVYCSLLTENEFESIKNTYENDYSQIIDIVPETEREKRTKMGVAYSTERDEIISFTAPTTPQEMYLISYVKDSGGKITTNKEIINVSDATSPILFIASPSNNEIPVVQMSADNKNAIASIKGQTIDTSGCSYLEFVWVPNSVEEENSQKSRIAKQLLNDIAEEKKNKEYAPKNDAVKVTVFDTGAKLWSVKLGEEEITNTGYIKQNFEFDIDILNDFVFETDNEKNENKFFIVKVTRKDGKSTIQEYKLSADTTKPKIISVNPKNTTQIIESGYDFELEFYAEKDNGLAIDPSKYQIIERIKDVETVLANENKYAISKDVLSKYELSGTIPMYIFSAEDIFGNKISTTYTVVVSSLPQLKTITSTAQNVKKGEEIIFNANFSETVGDNSAFEQNKPFLVLEGFSDGIPRKAEYFEGAGSPTLRFKYVAVEGDKSDGIQIKYDDDYGLIDPNGNTNLKEGIDIHLKDGIDINKDNYTDYVLKDKTISVDAVSPKILSYEVIPSGVEKNEDGNYYLNEGKSITAKVVFSEELSDTGAPEFNFTNGMKLKFDSLDSKTFIFTGKISDTDQNGTLSCSNDDSIFISNVENIVDKAGNKLLLSGNIDGDLPSIVVDTKSPEVPSIKKENGEDFPKTDNYQSNVPFKIISNDTDVMLYEYSLNGGTSWVNAANGVGTVSIPAGEDILFAELTARVTDKAGNVSEYPESIELNIKNSFPNFSVECTNPDGYYKLGDEIKFKVSFEEKIKVVKTNENTKIQIAEGKYASLTTTVSDKELTSIDFSYKVETGDEFTISIPENGINLGDSVVDLFGFTQNGKSISEDYERSGVKCDAVAPTVKTMFPNDGTTAAQNFNGDVTNIYKTGNEIRITFSEPVQKGSGNLILRQTAGWAIPPVLTASEYNTICAELDYEYKNILARQDENGKLEEDMEDTSVGIKHRNNEYHGTGQYIGPYKKSMQGIKLENGNYVPDIDTKFVLDFDIGIWETTETHPIGKTFENHAYKAPTSTTSAGEIRGALEEAGLHQRVLDVTSANVKVNGNEVTITFPKGLIDQTDALPNGREWELVFEKGTFLDITGNEFGEGLTKDAIQENGTQTEVSNTWKRGRTSITDGSKPLVLIKTNGNEFFNSDKVATPVVRVDRYSYGLGIRQANADGNLTVQIANDGVKPTGYVRVRIDCETKDATVVYSETKVEKDNNSANSENTTYSNAGATSYYTTTNITSYDLPVRSYTTNSIFAVGSGDYKKSYKGIIAAKGTKNSFTSSDDGIEGVFQTVVYFSNPITGNNTSCSSLDSGKTDISIRGTTGFAGEPYISPFPLRDSRVGSPYLRIVFREKSANITTNDYYWVSYEVLVESSFSNYCHGKDDWDVNYYDWARNWGIMNAGEFTRVEGMKGWRN